MADESKQGESTEQDESKGEETDATEGRDGDKGGDEDKPGAALLKALQDERDARKEAERKLKKREADDRKAETDRAIKAGEWEAVAKAKDGEIADLITRIAELEAAIASAQLDTARERVAAKYKLPPIWAARLRGDDEASLDADAKELSKTVVVKAPNTEAGAGSNGGDAKAAMRRAHEEAAAQNPRYTPF